jgi:alpha-tubulin suppressor-like RCC1 family protein
MAAGALHSLAIKGDGTLWAWGYNDDGQLGDGTTTQRLAPVQVGSSTWLSVTAGHRHSLAIKGGGPFGRSGAMPMASRAMVPTSPKRNTPIQVGSGTWVSVAAGDFHSLAIKGDGTLWAWGYNSGGQLGDGTNTKRLAPVQVGSSTWLSVAAGQYYSLGIQ